MVRLLAEHGADVDARGDDGFCSAYWAAQQGFTEVVRVLAEFGANLDGPDGGHASPMYAAAQSGQADMVRLGLELIPIPRTKYHPFA